MKDYLTEFQDVHTQSNCPVYWEKVEWHTESVPEPRNLYSLDTQLRAMPVQMSLVSVMLFNISVFPRTEQAFLLT
jgi:hypothetical protein